METFLKMIRSTVGRKVMMGISGLLLVGFVIVHLFGNLTLLAPSGEAFNHYSHKLSQYGVLLYVSEIVLALLFLFHIASAMRVRFEGKKARGAIKYRCAQSKGGPSHWGVSSLGMLWTGIVLLAFLVLHMIQFRFGPSISEGYVTQINGQPVRDLYLLVWQVFQEPLFVVIYVLTMLFLGIHLRHGFWSAFQSLGLAFPRCDRLIQVLGVCIAVLLAIGFLIIPLWIYFQVPQRLLGVF